MRGPLYCCVIFHTSSTIMCRTVWILLLLSMSVEREIKERLATGMEMPGVYLSGQYTPNAWSWISEESDCGDYQIACDRFCRWAYRIADGSGSHGRNWKNMR